MLLSLGGRGRTEQNLCTCPPAYSRLAPSHTALFMLARGCSTLEPAQDLPCSAHKVTLSGISETLEHSLCGSCHRDGLQGRSGVCRRLHAGMLSHVLPALAAFRGRRVSPGHASTARAASNASTTGLRPSSRADSTYTEPQGLPSRAASNISSGERRDSLTSRELIPSFLDQ